MTPAGTVMWTASSAGWFVLYYATRLPEAFMTGCACAIVAVLWHWVQNDMA